MGCLPWRRDPRGQVYDRFFTVAASPLADGKSIAFASGSDVGTRGGFPLAIGYWLKGTPSKLLLSHIFLMEGISQSPRERTKSVHWM